MCGIIGVAGKIGEKEKRFARQALIVDVLRGKHSTGMVYTDYEGHQVHKEAWLPQDFLAKASVESQFKKATKCIIGHNRAATVGSVTKANAHPFDFDKVVGVHNGTLKKRTELDNYRDFSVDSENLYHHINKFGLEDAINKCEGAYALVWVDKENNILNFYRNEERPLAYCYSEDGQTLFWASEPAMLRFVLARVGIEHKTVYWVNEFEHYKIQLPKGFGGIGGMVRSQLKPEEKPKEKKYNTAHTWVHPLVNKLVSFDVVAAEDWYISGDVVGDTCEGAEVRVYCHKGNYPDIRKMLESSPKRIQGQVVAWNPKLKFLTVAVATCKEEVPNNSTSNVVEIQKDHEGKYINQGVLNKRYGGECAWCTDILEVGHTVCIDNQTAVCEDCASLEDVKLFIGGSNNGKH